MIIKYIPDFIWFHQFFLNVLFLFWDPIQGSVLHWTVMSP